MEIKEFNEKYPIGSIIELTDGKKVKVYSECKSPLDKDLRPDTIIKHINVPYFTIIDEIDNTFCFCTLEDVVEIN